ncbi:MAG: hypothetical protein K2O39_06085 [Clostridiales bacterium]|nr:hypothetical protein [Clostridiales bacterium]
MKIGIPRSLLYYKHHKFWTTFFDEIGVDYIVSPETDKQIVTDGSNLAIDEACLPSKIMLGHVEWLLDKCDYIFVPRQKYWMKYEMCTKFWALPDVVNTTFRDRNVKLLYYDIYDRKVYRERKAVYKMGKYLGVKRSQIKYAYIMAKQAQMNFDMLREQQQKAVLESSDKTKILIVAHSYCVGDKYIGEPIINAVKALGCEPIIADYVDEREGIRASQGVTTTMQWPYNRQLVGAVELLKDKVDGIILVTAFPCGTDSMMDELLIRKYKYKPMITLTVDAQSGTAGMETRLESFVDIIELKKQAQQQSATDGE